VLSSVGLEILSAKSQLRNRNLDRLPPLIEVASNQSRRCQRRACCVARNCNLFWRSHMPRLSVVEPSTATGKVKEIFDGPLKGKHLNAFKGMGNSAAALNAYLALSGALAHGMLNVKEREVIALATAELNACGYCLAAHTTFGKMAGLTEPQMLAARGKN